MPPSHPPPPAPESALPHLDFQPLSTPKVLRLVQEARRHRQTDPGAYLTLSVVGPDRRETQLARLPADWDGPVRVWLERRLRAYDSPLAQTRFRLRLWADHGKAVGSVTFRLTYPGRPTTLPPAPEPSSDPPGLTAVEARLERLEGLLEALASRVPESPLPESQLPQDFTELKEQTYNLGERMDDAATAILKLHERLETLERKHLDLFNAFLKLARSLR